VESGVALVDLWIIDLRLPGWQDLDEHRPLLSVDERERAASFVDAESATEHLAGCVASRLLMAGWRSTGTTAIEVGLREKPQSVDGGLLFNRSHSWPWLVLAAADGGDLDLLGVDVEVRRSVAAPLAFARRILSQEERDPSVEPSPEYLLHAWTVKEAALKATGLGLHGDPRAWRLDWSTPDYPRLRVAPAEAGAPERWWFGRWDIEAPAASMALAVRRLRAAKVDVRLQWAARPQDLRNGWRPHG
jgi:phosphopantetheinyl transferase